MTDLVARLRDDLTRTELRRIAEEFMSERDAAKQDALRAFDERDLALNEIERLHGTLADINDALRIALGDDIEGMERERIEKLAERVAELERDAGRYRWLRDTGDETWHPLAWQPQHNAQMIDTWIDKAREGEK